MRLKPLFFIVTLLTVCPLVCQVTPEEEGFKTYRIEQESDTIEYYVRMPKDKEATHLFIHIQGSAPSPIWFKVNDICCGTTDIFNRNLIPKDYAYVMISKQGYSFSGKREEVPSDFWKKNTLDFRVNRVDQVIKHIQKNIFKPEKIVVVGTSQGCDVAAKLGTVNKDVTHLGFWASGGLNQLSEFLWNVRKDVYRGKITETESKKITDSLLNQFQEFYKNPTPDKIWDENSYLSYVSFSEPPLDNLLKLDIPIFVAIGSKDENVSIESAYLIPIEFMRHNKTNLSFNQYTNYDHGFVETKPDGSQVDQVDKVTREFFEWVENTN